MFCGVRIAYLQYQRRGFCFPLRSSPVQINTTCPIPVLTSLLGTHRQPVPTLASLAEKGQRILELGDECCAVLCCAVLCCDARRGDRRVAASVLLLLLACRCSVRLSLTLKPDEKKTRAAIKRWVGAVVDYGVNAGMVMVIKMKMPVGDLQTVMLTARVVGGWPAGERGTGGPACYAGDASGAPTSVPAAAPPAVPAPVPGAPAVPAAAAVPAAVPAAGPRAQWY
eukprot:396545-Rhodomonas_salina.1